MGTAGFAGQLHRTFVKAHLGVSRIIRFSVQVQHIFHMPNILGTDTGNTPFLTLPRFEGVFLRMRRTLSREMASKGRSSMKRSANNCTVHRQRPAGGVLQAKATKKTACLPVRVSGDPDRDRSCNAAINPSSTNRWRVRCTVEIPRWSVWAMASSVAPSSARSNT